MHKKKKYNNNAFIAFYNHANTGRYTWICHDCYIDDQYNCFVWYCQIITTITNTNNASIGTNMKILFEIFKILVVVTMFTKIIVVTLLET